MVGSQDDIPPPPPPPSQTPTKQTPHTVSTIKLPKLKNLCGGGENDVKGSTASSSSTQNVAFISENTSTTNDVSTAYGISNPSGQNSQYEHASSYSLLANQSSCPQLDHEDLEQLDEFNLEEMDLKWNWLVLIKPKSSVIIVTRQGILLESAEQREIKIVRGEMLGTLEIRMGEDLGSDTKVTSCSKECKESYAKLKNLYDAQREQLRDANSEDEQVSLPTEEQNTPSFADRQVKPPKENY
ncbi:hypothetical protein Tco_0872418 [Tanacetum coccineum]